MFIDISFIYIYIFNMALMWLFIVRKVMMTLYLGYAGGGGGT